MIDFLIIGGGIAGTSAAALFAPMGETVLLEAEKNVGHHASGRSAAIFFEEYGNETVRALNRASKADLEQIGALSKRGLLLVASRSQTAHFESECRETGAVEIPMLEAVQKFPILNVARCTKAAYTENALDLDTDHVMQSNLRTARDAGAQVMVDEKVEEITKTSQGWQIETRRNSFSARIIINAAGAWADDVADKAGLVKLGIQPYRRSMAQLPPPIGQSTQTWPMVISCAGDWYAKPSSAGLIVSPNDEYKCDPHDAWADDMTIAEGLARYEQMSTVPVSRVQSTWAGLRSFAPDRSLVIGPDPDAPDFLWFAGQGGYGFQTSPAAAQLLALLANGRESDVLSPETVAALSPQRFH